MAGDLHWLITGFLQAMTHAERKLFATYFKAYRSVLGEALPALLPQVYLHNEPAVIKRRDGRWRENRREWRRVGFVGRAAV